MIKDLNNAEVIEIIKSYIPAIIILSAVEGFGKKAYRILEKLDKDIFIRIGLVLVFLFFSRALNKYSNRSFLYLILIFQLLLEISFSKYNFRMPGIEMDDYIEKQRKK